MSNKKWNDKVKWLKKQKENHLNNLQNISKPKNDHIEFLDIDIGLTETEANKLMGIPINFEPKPEDLTWGSLKPNENFQMQTNNLYASRIATLYQILTVLEFPSKNLHPDDKYHLAHLIGLPIKIVEERISEFSDEQKAQEDGLEFFITACPKMLSSHGLYCDCFEDTEYFPFGVRIFVKNTSGEWRTGIPGNPFQKVNFSKFIGVKKHFNNGFHPYTIEIGFMILSKEIEGYCYVGRVAGINGDKIYVRWKEDTSVVVLTLDDIQILTTGSDPLNLGPGRYKKIESVSPNGVQPPKYKMASGFLIEDFKEVLCDPEESKPAFSSDPFAGRIVDLGIKED